MVVGKFSASVPSRKRKGEVTSCKNSFLINHLSMVKHQHTLFQTSPNDSKLVAPLNQYDVSIMQV